MLSPCSGGSVNAVGCIVGATVSVVWASNVGSVTDGTVVGDLAVFGTSVEPPGTGEPFTWADSLYGATVGTMWIACGDTFISSSACLVVVTRLSSFTAFRGAHEEKGSNKFEQSTSRC